MKRYQKRIKELKKCAEVQLLGFSSSSISDITSNTFRVIKTNRQTSETNISYTNLVKNIIKKESIIGLMTRGLKTKIITNGIQGMCFTIIFDYLRKN